MADQSIVYASFDRFPSPKGASTHIGAFVQALGKKFGQVDLLTLQGDENIEAPDFHGVRHHPLPAIGPNIITRALAFRSELLRWWRRRHAGVAHVRSIYEGYPIAKRKKEMCDFFVFEINGLPSIELKYHYPDVDDDKILMDKLRSQEDLCMKVADLIITVSDVNAEYLKSRGVNPEVIKVIPNGVNLDIFQWKEPMMSQLKPLRILYSGTMTRWQGVHYALEALALYIRDYEAEMILAGPCRAHERRAMNRTIDKFKIAKNVRIIEPLSQKGLVDLMHNCDVALAPLLPNDRNLEQGCCPLKIIEAMATGIPVISSDMPVVRALVENGKEALLVKPASAKAIKDGLLALRGNLGLAKQLSKAARTRVENDFTWKKSTENLIVSYQNLGLK